MSLGNLSGNPDSLPPLKLIMYSALMPYQCNRIQEIETKLILCHMPFNPIDRDSHISLPSIKVPDNPGHDGTG